MSDKKTVFITGGAGFLGINLTRHLLAKGYNVTSYDILPFDYPEKDLVKTVSGDIRDAAALKKAMQGADLVVHTAAALPLYTADEIYTTDVEGTRNVLQTALDLKVERFVHISSTAVYGIPDHHPLKEDDRLDGVGPYGEAKILAEYECLKYRAKGMVTSIIRPKSFVGPERLGVFALFYDWAKDKKGFPMIGNGKNRYQLLDVEDLSEAIYLCLTRPVEKVNDVFNIGAKEFTTMAEDYQAVLDEAGHGKKIKGLPASPIIMILRAMEAMNISPLYKWVYETASKDSFVSIEKAEAQLGYKPKHSNKDALIRNYRWYVANMENFAKQSGVTHRVPWKQGALGFFKMFF
jgi:nucleoside-diphosphate-sugar epimerase